VAGRIPYDPAVTEAVVHGVPVTEYRPDTPASQALKDLWQHVAALLDGARGDLG
jgi:MinD-like ATPase involved in chromosome partitioning or flagellar assembly